MKFIQSLFSSRIARAAAKVLAVAAIAAVIAYRLLFAPVSVRAFSASTQDITAEVMGTGTLEAKVRASISPRIAGRMTSVQVDQGGSRQEGATACHPR